MTFTMTQHPLHLNLYKEAKKSNVNHKYAAVIFHRNKIVGIGHNFITSVRGKLRECVLCSL
jgi:hypothetical protein